MLIFLLLNSLHNVIRESWRERQIEIPPPSIIWQLSSHWTVQGCKVHIYSSDLACNGRFKAICLAAGKESTKIYLLYVFTQEKLKTGTLRSHSLVFSCQRQGNTIVAFIWAGDRNTGCPQSERTYSVSSGRKTISMFSVAWPSFRWGKEEKNPTFLLFTTKNPKTSDKYETVLPFLILWFLPL